MRLAKRWLHVIQKVVHSCLDIGRYACLHGTSAVARHFSKKLGHPINVSTVHSIKKAFKEGKEAKSAERDDEGVSVLPPKKCRRPVLLGEELQRSSRTS